MSLLKAAGVKFEIVEYLKHPLSLSELHSLSKKLGMHPRDFSRKGEAEFRSQKLQSAPEDPSVFFEAIARCPKIMERPIAVKGDRAVIGRPPERVLTLLE